jgi:hypothetical protein
MVSCTPVSLLAPNRGGACTIADLKRGGKAAAINTLFAWGRIHAQGKSFAPPVMLLHGPHGCGKSECIRVLARTGGWRVWYNDTPAVLREPREAGAVWSSEACRAFARGDPPILIVLEDLDACTTGSQSETIHALCEVIDEYLAAPPIHAAIIITVGGSNTDALCARIATRLTSNIVEVIHLNNRPISAAILAGHRAAPSTTLGKLHALARCAHSGNDIRWVALNAQSAGVALRARAHSTATGRGGASSAAGGAAGGGGGGGGAGEEEAAQEHDDDDEMDADVVDVVANAKHAMEDTSPLHFIAKMTDIAAAASDIRGVCSTGAQLRSWLQIYTAAALAQRAAMGWGATKNHPAPSNGRKRRHGSGDMHDYPLPSTARTADANKKHASVQNAMQRCGVGTANTSSCCTHRALGIIASVWRNYPNDRERHKKALATLVPACASLFRRKRSRNTRIETKNEAVNRVMDDVLTVGWPNSAKVLAARRLLFADLLAACP